MPSSFSRAASDRSPLSPADNATLLLRRLPKAELHLHHMGAQSLSEFARLSELAGLAEPSAQSAPYRSVEHDAEVAALRARTLRSAYDNLGSAKFFDDLDRSVSLWPNATAVTAGVVRIAGDAFDHGVRHLELLCTPTLNEQQTGLPVREVLMAIGAGMRIAAETFGMSGGIIVDVHRFDGPAAAVDLVEQAIDLAADDVPVLGFGSDGDHQMTPLAALEPAFNRARAAGYRLTAHADSLDDVRTALDLGLDRIDHGWVAAADDGLLSRIVQTGIPMTFCPMAYVISQRPSPLDWVGALRVLLDAGVPVIIGTDDPALHHTDLAHSYELVANRLGWGAAEIAHAARTSFECSWGPATERDARLARIDDEIAALVLDARGMLPAHLTPSRLD